MSILCSVYRSPRREQMYLYIDRSEGFERVPDQLLQQFGEPEEVLTIKLDGQRKLARADAQVVLENIKDQGFYLQMPPSVEQTGYQNAD